MGVQQAAGMRGVLRLNKESTFSGRPLLSARPDVGGPVGESLEGYQEWTERILYRRSQECEEVQKSRERKGEKVGEVRRLMRKIKLRDINSVTHKNTNTLNIQGRVLKIYSSGFGHIYFLSVSTLVCLYVLH